MTGYLINSLGLFVFAANAFAIETGNLLNLIGHHTAKLETSMSSYAPYWCENEER